MSTAEAIVHRVTLYSIGSAAIGVGFLSTWYFAEKNRFVLGLVVCVIGLIVAWAFRAMIPRGTRSSLTVLKKTDARDAEFQDGRAIDLIEYERLLNKTTYYASDLWRIRPALRQLAAARLAEQGIDLDRDPEAEVLLGDLYGVIGPGANEESGVFGKGLSIEALETMIGKLEETS